MCYNDIGIEAVNLGSEILALSSVQKPREMTAEKSCHVFLSFQNKEASKIHFEGRTANAQFPHGRKAIDFLDFQR